MIIREAIGSADELVPNSYTNNDKIRWLNTLDGKIKKELIDMHEGGDDIRFDGYGDVDMEKELLVSAPYDCIYPLYIEMQIHYYDGDTARYNNAASAFDAAYSDFAAWYNRTRLPIQRKRSFW